MSGDERDQIETGVGSPALPRTPATEIAERILSSEPDYEKLKTRDQIKAALVERDAELRVLSEEFQTQSDTIVSLRGTVQFNEGETARLKKENQVVTARANKLTDALLAATVDKTPADTAAPVTATYAEAVQEAKASTSADDVHEEPKSYAEDPQYLAEIAKVDLDKLDLVAEAATMILSADITVEDGEKFQYPVPVHLMGLLVGRQKATTCRIANQTSTEIEQGSWSVDDGNDTTRMMGFIIQGSAEAIKSAIDAMIATVRNMGTEKASKLISGHLKRKSADDNKKAKKAKQDDPTKKAPGGQSGGKVGSKSKKTSLCPHYIKGKCNYGVKCWNKHSFGLSH